LPCLAANTAAGGPLRRCDARRAGRTRIERSIECRSRGRARGAYRGPRRRVGKAGAWRARGRANCRGEGALRASHACALAKGAGVGARSTGCARGAGLAEGGAGGPRADGGPHQSGGADRTHQAGGLARKGLKSIESTRHAASGCGVGARTAAVGDRGVLYRDAHRGIAAVAGAGGRTRRRGRERGTRHARGRSRKRLVGVGGTRQNHGGGVGVAVEIIDGGDFRIVKEAIVEAEVGHGAAPVRIAPIGFANVVAASAHAVHSRAKKG